MENRWCRLLRFLSIFALLMALINIGMLLCRFDATNKHTLIYVLETAAMFIFSATSFMALQNINRMRRGEKAGFVPPFQIVYPLVLFLVIFCMILIFFI